MSLATEDFMEFDFQHVSIDYIQSTLIGRCRVARRRLRT
jgi:hypothetical protein